MAQHGVMLGGAGQHGAGLAARQGDGERLAGARGEQKRAVPAQRRLDPGAGILEQRLCRPALRMRRGGDWPRPQSPVPWPPARRGAAASWPHGRDRWRRACRVPCGSGTPGQGTVPAGIRGGPHQHCEMALPFYISPHPAAAATARLPSVLLSQVPCPTSFFPVPRGALRGASARRPARVHLLR